MGLHAEVNKELPPNVSLAHDGLVLDFWYEAKSCFVWYGWSDCG
jgi:hypothetical protein